MAARKGSNKKNNTAAPKRSGGNSNASPSPVWPVVIIVIAVFLELSNLSLLGTVGGYLKYAQFGLFGSMAYILPLIIIALCIYKLIVKTGIAVQAVFGMVFFLCLCIIAQLASKTDIKSPVLEFFTAGARYYTGGGIIGGTVAAGLYYAISRSGTIIVVVLLMLLSIFMIFRTVITDFFESLFSDEKALERAEKKAAAEKLREKERAEAAKARAKRREQKNEIVVPSGGETVIRIVNESRRHKASYDRAKLKRAGKKAEPLRDGSVRIERAGRVQKGVGDTTIENSNFGGDEIHEITNATAAPKEPVKAPGDENRSVIRVTDIIEEEKEIRKKEDHVPETTGEKTPARSVINAADAEVFKQDASKTQKDSLAGKNLSKGEADKSFKPHAVIRGGADDPDALLPRIDLLSRSTGSAVNNDAATQANRLEEVLKSFGVEARVVNTQVGPSVTRFELEIAMGTRVSKITALADDLKLNLAVPEIRIEAPIPGKAAVGIEIPNKTRNTVMLRELLEDPGLMHHSSKIAFAAGKDISGNVVVADLAKMPHILVAGTTGSGKSVFLNSILMCILYRAKPAEVGLLIIDPKRVEFGIYSGIPHLLRDVVTDPQQAVSILRWAVSEMTSRYQRMQLSGVRDFKSYNDKYDREQLNPEEESPRRMKQIVIIIDELADLMMVAAKEVESLICRLAQLARAAGIHLVIATQRPSVDVVTGLIKANIPARAALLVASGVDSRTIIDMVGAEKLLGNGDMLFYPTGYVKPVRVQGAFVSDNEIMKTVRFLKDNMPDTGEDRENEQEQEINNFIANSASAQNGSADDQTEEGAGNYDEFLYDAGKLCIDSEKASSSMLQRRFSIGFNRAARIIDQLYEIGAIGPQNGAKPREILVDSVTFDEICQEHGII